jgi:hypothetical protein
MGRRHSRSAELRLHGSNCRRMNARERAAGIEGRGQTRLRGDPAGIHGMRRRVQLGCYPARQRQSTSSAANVSVLGWR